MLAHRRFLTLALLLMIGTGAVLAASALVFAQDKSHVDDAQHTHGREAIVATMPGQEAFGTIQERIQDCPPSAPVRQI